MCSPELQLKKNHTFKFKVGILALIVVCARVGVGDFI